MIEISGWLLAIIEQAIIVLIFLVVFFYFRSRRLKKIVSKLTEKNQQLSESQAGSHPEVNALITESELEQLHNKVQLYEQSVKNLERFRDMFFDIKHKYEAYDAMQVKVLTELDQALPPGETADVLKETLEKLRTEKEQLEQHLKQVEAELDMLMEHPSEERTEANVISEKASEAGNLIQAQVEEIQRLKQYVVDLTLEAALKDTITGSLEGLERKNTELAMALEILQDENQFLLNQIQELLRAKATASGDTDKQTKALREKLAQVEQEHRTLQKKFVALESEYLSLTQQTKQ